MGCYVIKVPTIIKQYGSKIVDQIIRAVGGGLINNWRILKMTARS